MKKAIHKITIICLLILITPGLGQAQTRDKLSYHCLIAIDLKIGSFKPEYAGKMNFHLELLDEQAKMPGENASIGIILCAEKENLEVEYALRTSTKPMGVAEYQLSPVLPEGLSGVLPSPEEIKRRIQG